MEEERKALQNMILDSIRLGYTPHLLLNNTMQNKLQEILDEFDNLPICFNYGERATMRRFLSEKLAEYAQHVTRIGSSDPLWTEFQACRYAFEKRIDQDLLSLKEKNK